MLTVFVEQHRPRCAQDGVDRSLQCVLVQALKVLVVVFFFVLRGLRQGHQWPGRTGCFSAMYCSGDDDNAGTGLCILPQPQGLDVLRLVLFCDAALVTCLLEEFNRERHAKNGNIPWEA